MTCTPTLSKIPLDRLVLSPTNVRKTPAAPAEDAELKASIRAGGLKQNLIVHPTTDDATRFAVTAGGRRLKALQELAAEGALPADCDIPCLVEEPDAAIETSLMENTVRAAMHPADEFVAMAALIDAGGSIEQVAARFGASERRVRQRLRLGKLAPELLDAFRAGALSLDAIMAFTLGADHAAQLAVWGQVNEQHFVSPHQVRRLLTDGAIPLDGDLGAFVGVGAYEAAGGRVTRDLFSTDDDGFMDDAALVRHLAIEKLEAKAAELRGEWAWAKPVLDPEYHFMAEYRRIEPEPAEYPPEIAAELEQIEERLGEFEQLAEDEFTDDLMTEAARLEERRDEIIETTEAEAVYGEADRKRSGCIVTIGEDGEFLVYRGLVDRSAPTADADAGEAGDGDESAAFAVTVHGARSSSTAMLTSRGGAAPLTGEQLVRKDCGFSQSHIDDLKAHRLQITKAYLAGDFGVAFDLMLYALCVGLIDQGYRTLPLDLRAAETPMRSTLNDLAGTPADRLLAAHEQALDTAWLSLPSEEGFAALAVLPIDAKHRLFAWCVAAMLKPQLGIEDRADPVIEAAGHRLTIPFADLWRPTAANYWSRVRKAHGLAVAKDVLGPRWARDHEGDKKAVLAAALEAAFDPVASSGAIHLDQAARDAAAVWLPPGFAYAEPATGGAPPAENGAIEPADGEPVDQDGDSVEADDVAEADDIPAFLTGDLPSGVRPNGAAVP